MWKPLDCSIALAGTLALAISFAAGPVLAQEATPASETEVTDGREPTVLICKRLALTGTRIEHDYCLTEDDWDAIREDSQTAIMRLLRIGTET